MKYENQKPDLADQIKALVQSANSVKTVPHGIKTVNPGEGLQLLSSDGQEIFWDWETAAEYDSRISEGREAIDQAQSELAQARLDLDAGAARVAENRQLLDALGPRVDAAQSQVTQTAQDLTSVDTRLTTTAGELSTLKTTVGDVSAAVTASEKKASDALAKSAQAQASADGKNRITRSTSPASGAGTAVGDTHFVMSSMGGGGRVVRQQRWDGSTWQDETVSHEVIASLDLGKATVGELDGQRIAVGSLYADRIVSGVSQNMVPDPGFVNPALNAVRIQRAITYGTNFNIADGVLSCTPTGETRNNDSNISMGVTTDLYSWPAYPSMKLAVTCIARVRGGGTGSFRWTIRMKFRDGTTTYRPLEPITFTPLTGAWATYSAGLDLPENITSYSVSFQVGRDSTGVIEMRSPMAASKTGSVLIENGAVTGEKVNAESVAAVVGQFVKVQAANVEVTESLAARVVNTMATSTKNLVVTESAILQHTTLLGTTVADELNVIGTLRGRDAILDGTVDVAQLNVTGSMSAEIVKAMDIQARRGIFTEGLTAADATLLGTTVAENLNAGTVASRIMTGGLLQTTAAANRGVKIDNSGIKAWDDSGSQTVNISGTANYIVGEFSTAPDKQRVRLRSRGGIAAADFFGSNSTVDHLGVWHTSSSVPENTVSKIVSMTGETQQPHDPGLHLYPTRGEFAFAGRWAVDSPTLKFWDMSNFQGLPGGGWADLTWTYANSFASDSKRMPYLSVEARSGAECVPVVIEQTATYIKVRIVNKSANPSGTIYVRCVVFNINSQVYSTYG